MTEGKTFIKSLDFGAAYSSLHTASSTMNLIMSGVLKYSMVNIFQRSWFCAVFKYHLTSFYLHMLFIFKDIDGYVVPSLFTKSGTVLAFIFPAKLASIA